MSAVQFQIRPFDKNASQTEYIALNQHLAQFEIMVVSECRRMGLGRQLLRPIAEAAQQENRRLLTTSTVDRIPGGEAFMLRLGAQKGLEAHTNQLRITDLDRSLLERCYTQDQQLAWFQTLHI